MQLFPANSDWPRDNLSSQSVKYLLQQQYKSKINSVARKKSYLSFIKFLTNYPVVVMCLLCLVFFFVSEAIRELWGIFKWSEYIIETREMDLSCIISCADCLYNAAHLPLHKTCTNRYFACKVNKLLYLDLVRQITKDADKVKTENISSLS